MIRLAIRLGALTVVGLLSMGWLAVQIGQLNGPAGQFAKTYSVSASFTDATGIVSGDEVRMAGVRIGKVGGVGVDHGKASVKLNIDKRFDVPKDSRFLLRWRNLLGQRFVQVVPPKAATPDGPAMAAGTKVANDRTASAADLSYLLNNAEPLLANLDTEGVNRVMVTLADAMQGRETSLGQAIDQSAALVKTLSARADTIGSSIHQFADLLDTIAGHDDQVRQLLSSLSTTSQTLAARSGDLGRAVDGADAFTATLARVLESSGGDLDAALQSADAITGVLAKDKKELAEGLRTLNWTPAAFIRATNAGDWINIYGRSFGFIDTYMPEPRVGPDYSNVGPDATQGGPTLLGQPKAPTPPVPETDAGPIVVNPSKGRQPSRGAGLGALLAPMAGGS